MSGLSTLIMDSCSLGYDNKNINSSYLDDNITAGDNNLIKDNFIKDN